MWGVGAWLGWSWEHNCLHMPSFGGHVTSSYLGQKDVSHHSRIYLLR